MSFYIVDISPYMPYTSECVTKYGHLVLCMFMSVSLLLTESCNTYTFGLTHYGSWMMHATHLQIQMHGYECRVELTDIFLKI